MAIKILNMNYKKQLSIILIFQLITFSCSNWRQVNQSDYDSLNQEKNTILVRLTNNKKYETSNYEIRTDSLVIENKKSLFYEGSLIYVPLDSISTIKIRKVNTSATIIVGVVTIGSFIAVIGAFRALGGIGDGLK